MIRNIVWDVDGTLFDTYPAIAQSYHQAVNALGSDAPFDWILQAARVTMRHCVSSLAERCGLPEEEISRKADAYYDKIPAAAQPPLPGVVDICRYICSLGGKNLIVTHRGQRGVDLLLSAHGMTDLFAGCITRDDGYLRKPDPAAFLATVELHQLSLAETINVGDREIDIIAGQGAGLFSCLFEPGEVDTAADLVVHAYHDLLAILPILDATRGRRNP